MVGRIGPLVCSSPARGKSKRFCGRGRAYCRKFSNIVKRVSRPRSSVCKIPGRSQAILRLRKLSRLAQAAPRGESSSATLTHARDQCRRSCKTASRRAKKRRNGNLRPRRPPEWMKLRCWRRISCKPFLPWRFAPRNGCSKRCPLQGHWMNEPVTAHSGDKNLNGRNSSDYRLHST